MYDFRNRQPLVRELVHAFPGDAMLFVAASSSGAPPDLDDSSAEGVQAAVVPRHSIVPVMA